MAHHYGPVRTAHALAIVAAVLALSAPAGAEPTARAGGSHDATSHRSFDDVDHWVEVFDDPTRVAWQKPAEVVKALDLRPGMSVADLGAGTGYFSRYLSEAVGPAGVVFVVEIEPKLVVHLRDRADRENTRNVIPILASADNPRLPRGALNLILIVDTFHHIDGRVRYLRSLAGALKPGGRVAVIDWKKKDLPVGPPLKHRLSRSQVEEEMRLAGYTPVATSAILPYQYFLVFRR